MTPDSPSTMKLASRAILRLDELKSPMQVSSGQGNIFAMRLNEGKCGTHHFVMHLATAASLFPIPALQEQGHEYIFAFIAGEDAQLAPLPTGDEGSWKKRWQQALYLNYGKKESSADNLYLEFIRAITERSELRSSNYSQNQKLSEQSLIAKVEHLGRMASVNLKKNSQEEVKGDALEQSLREIARLYNLPLNQGIDGLFDHNQKPEERFKTFCNRKDWRTRKVLLREDFHKQSSMPLLSFRQSNGQPLIIFPSSQGSTYIDANESMQKKKMNKKVLTDISNEAYYFYELFPEEKRDTKNLLSFIFRNIKPIIVLCLLTGIISSVMGLVSPVATAYVTGKIIPTANLPELWQITAVLIVLLTCQLIIGLVPSLITMLFGVQQFERFQAALFDHILRIPVQALKRCDAGDMTQRVLGASQIQSTLFSLVSQQFISSIFSLSSLAMMFYYNKSLSIVGIGLVLVYAFSFFLLTRLNLKPLATQAAASGRVSGLTKQFFDGVAKIRSAGAETRVISRFMDDFSIATQETYKISTLGSYQSILTSAFPMLISLIFYAMVGSSTVGQMSFPIFLAFMAAFQNFQGGVMGLAGGLWTLLALKPEVDRIMPILKEPIEDKHDKHHPGQLKGDIEISHLNFRYDKDGPLILNDVSIHAKAGEFIAIVGASGAGKSTLMRLLLGFEKYEAGGIYYSGKELTQLHLRALRSQLGVILQNSRVMPASILDNVAIGTEYGEKEVFEALKLASYDSEVRQLPMGVHTLITPDNISGGQQQRILIARALIGKPVAVLMDESTSALDNHAQQIVKTNMEQLQMTRIIIAHRLSTIINADRIYVLDKGRVVAQGHYQELLQQGGVFKDLVTRQQLKNNEE